MEQYWERILRIQHDPLLTLECANACDEAYCIASGNTHTAITSVTSTAYKLNMAPFFGVLALLPAISMVNGMSDPYSDEAVESSLRVLEKIRLHAAQEKLELQTLLYALPALFANTLWNYSKLVFDRPDRENNFSTLVNAEFIQHIQDAQGVIEYDLIEIHAAAIWWAQQLGVKLD